MEFSGYSIIKSADSMFVSFLLAIRTRQILASPPLTPEGPSNFMSMFLDETIAGPPNKKYTETIVPDKNKTDAEIIIIFFEKDIFGFSGKSKRPSSESASERDSSQ